MSSPVNVQCIASGYHSLNSVKNYFSYVFTRLVQELCGLVSNTRLKESREGPEELLERVWLQDGPSVRRYKFTFHEMTFLKNNWQIIVSKFLLIGYLSYVWILLLLSLTVTPEDVCWSTKSYNYFSRYGFFLIKLSPQFECYFLSSYNGQRERVLTLLFLET